MKILQFITSLLNYKSEVKNEIRKIYSAHLNIFKLRTNFLLVVTFYFKQKVT